jgi:hypothetical protein
MGSIQYNKQYTYKTNILIHTILNIFSLNQLILSLSFKQNIIHQMHRMHQIIEEENFPIKNQLKKIVKEGGAVMMS